MSWKSTTRKAAVTLTTSALALIAILGSSLGTMATELISPKKTPHARSSLVAYIPGQPLVITIEQPYFEIGSTVTYAQINDPLGKLLGYLLPVGGTPATSKKKGQAVKSNRITVAFDTTSWYTLPPTNLSMLPPTEPIVPDVGSGSIIIINTNVPTDTPPELSIELETAQLTL